MGLDMYLSANRYVGGWDHSSAEEQKCFSGMLKALGLKRDQVAEGSPHLYPEVCVAYWRKANAIHAWFVRNVQKGVDDCGKYSVSRQQLQQLVDECKEVLASDALKDPTTAAEKLPTQGGFFFGGTDYDQWYIEDLKDTVGQLEKALQLREGVWDFQYHSSW